MQKIMLVLVCASLLPGCGGDTAKAKGALESGPACSVKRASSALASQAKRAPEIPSTRFIVKLRATGSARGQVATATARVDSLNAQLMATDTYVVKTARPLMAADLRKSLGDGVEYVEEDGLVYADYVSDDPELSRQWAHDKVGSPAAWDYSRGSASVIVAVLDSGVDYTHEDLAANIWNNAGEVAGNGTDDDGNGYVDDVRGWNFVSDTNDPQSDDKSNHGTHVAGTIGAVGNNGLGIAGHAPLVKLMPLKFLGANGSGYRSDAIRGIDYAIHHGAKIINNSWGSSQKSAALSDAIGRARDAGILFVAAAGNSGLDNDRFSHFPSNYSHDNIVRVAASDVADRLASFSNFGAVRVDLAAPGVSIYSTRNGDRYQSLSGTSMATPLVSGVLATMIALRPDLNYAQLKGALLESVDLVPGMAGTSVTGGRINASRALAFTADLPADWEPTPRPVSECL